MVDKIKVWDPFVRISHWLLLAAFITSYVTGDEETDLHFYSGYFILALVLLRIIWGFIGSEHARFRDFVVSPVEAVGYLKGLVTGNVRHYVGHNPAAAMMILALLLSVLATAGTGLTLHGFRGHGPLAFALAPSGAAALPTEAEVRMFRERRERMSHEEEEEEGDEHEGFGGERARAGTAAATSEGSSRSRFTTPERQRIRFWKEIHEFFVYLTIVLVVLHVGGVIASSMRHRENLVKSMFDGLKRKEASR